MAFFFSYFLLSSFPHYSGMLGPDLCSFLIRVELIVYDLMCLAFEISRHSGRRGTRTCDASDRYSCHRLELRFMLALRSS